MPTLLTTLASAASWVLIVAGALSCVISGIGMLRLPDLLSRVHAAALADSAGMLLILAGLMIQAGFAGATVKLLLVVLFLLITGPTATHALVRAARDGRQGNPRGPRP